MKVLYVFPHPDDESFGPAMAIWRQKRAGYRVFLLTLTRGGATKQRHEYGYSVEEMGRVRWRELRRAARVLELDGLTVLDLPDSGLKELDPREIERPIRKAIRRIQPAVVVTYAVHGISGFADHLVTHAAVKRVYCDLREDGPHAPRRLALFTLHPSRGEAGPASLNTSPEAEIDCAIPLDARDRQRAREALACYETYESVIRERKPLEQLGDTLHFELFQEDHDPPLCDLAEGLLD